MLKENYTGEGKDTFIRCAMYHGFLMGLFWAFKYIFFILGVSNAFFSYFYWGLTCLVPIFLAVLILHARVESLGNISFGRQWLLGILIYAFAAVFVSLVHYAFYRYFAPPEFIADSLNSAIQAIRDSGVSQEVKAAVEAMPTPTPILMTIQGIFNNILYGIIFSFPVIFYTNRVKVSKGTKQ